MSRFVVVSWCRLVEQSAAEQLLLRNAVHKVNVILNLRGYILVLLRYSVSDGCVFLIPFL